MLRPVGSLKTAVVLALLAGCAARPADVAEATSPGPAADATMASTTSEAATSATASRTSPASATPSAARRLPPLTPPRPAADPISAGRSQPGTSGLVDADGALKPDIRAWATEVADTRNIPQGEVEQLLREARYDAEVVRLMAPSRTRIRRSWETYRKRFVEPVRLRAGKEFQEAHRDVLTAVEDRYGVPASIIVAIIGVETIYGRYTGSFRVLDALATLGFRHPDAERPERSRLFRNQLADLMELHHQGQLDARTVTGSYAGAMGLPQFMPGSLLRFAVDGDGDGRIDLEHNAADAIASVAAYLRHHGWIPGLPVFAPVSVPSDARIRALVTGGIDPTLAWSELAHLGVHARGDDDAPWRNHPLGIVDLVDEPRGTVEYRVGTPNFFAITHYNRSYFYAAAVAALAKALE